jgi:hypothetical protein
MLKWIRRKIVEIVAEAFHVTQVNQPVALDDYADHQIAWLLWASAEYRKAKKDPEAFVERYFSAKIEPVKPFVDSWASLTLSDVDFMTLKSPDESI